MELVDVYTRAHKRAGQVIKRDEIPPKGNFLLVVHVCLFDCGGRMLLQRRSLNKDRYPGLWDISAGGFARSGEDAVSAAVRETEEELGVFLSQENLSYLTTEPFSYVLDDFFGAKIDPASARFRLQKEEVAETKWATEEEILSMRQNGMFVDYAPVLLERLFSQAKRVI